MHLVFVIFVTTILTILFIDEVNGYKNGCETSKALKIMKPRPKKGRPGKPSAKSQPKGTVARKQHIDAKIPALKSVNSDMSMYECAGGIYSPAARKAIVDTHNKLRSELIHGVLKNKLGHLMPRGKNMYKLTYNCTLERQAKSWANRCKFDHSPSSLRPGAGENIYMTSAVYEKDKQADVLVALGKNPSNAWWKELPDQMLDDRNLVLTSKVFSWGIGHFTQMAWAKTTSVGCGVAFCPKSTIVDCQYYQFGNMLNGKIYEKGNPCKRDSDCTTYSGSKCSTADGLCMKP